MSAACQTSFISRANEGLSYAYLSISEEAFSVSTPQNGTNYFNEAFGTSQPQENAIVCHFRLLTKRSVLTVLKWAYDYGAGLLGAQWTSEGNATTNNYISFVQTEGQVLMTGNTTAFIQEFGGSEIVSDSIDVPSSNH